MQLILGAKVAALAVCAWAAWVMVRGDYREQRIRNRHLLAGAAALLAVYAGLAAQTALAGQGARFLLWSFHGSVLLHLAVSAAFAVGMWRGGLWPAGDAKLFLFLSLALPAASLPGWFDPWRSALTALVNIFIPAALVTVGRAALFVWRLYVLNQVEHLKAIGLQRLPSYIGQALSVPSALLGRALADLREAADSPAQAALRAAGWLASIAFASALAARLQPVLGSTFLSTAVCFLALVASQRLTSRLPSGAVLGLNAGLAAALALPGGAVASGAAGLFAQLTVFGVSVNWGTGLARRLMEERGVVCAPVLAVMGWVVPMAVFGVAGLGGTGLSLLAWSALGVLFGGGYALVRVLEEQDCPTVRPDELRPALVLSDAFIDRLRQDADFFEEHLDPLYPDGLTADQARALRGWCERHGVGLVPLYSTVSFAFWIFLGWFLTWALGGHVLQWVR